MNTLKNGLGSGEGVQQPQQLRLLGKYPNPFNPLTKIVFSLQNPAEMAIDVFTPDGRRVKSIGPGLRTSGRLEFIFDGSNLASGLYYYTIYSTRTGFFEKQTAKMLLIK